MYCNAMSFITSALQNWTRINIKIPYPNGTWYTSDTLEISSFKVCLVLTIINVFLLIVCLSNKP